MTQNMSSNKCSGDELVLTRSGKSLQLIWNEYRRNSVRRGIYFKTKIHKLLPHDAVQLYGFQKVLEGFQKVFEEALKKLAERQANLQKRLDWLKK